MPTPNELAEQVRQVAVALGTLETTLGTIAGQVAAITTPPPPVPSTSFPGDVKAGHVRFGAAVGGNADPVARHETPAGRAIGVRRTYWDQGKIGSLVNYAKGDIAAGRLPWVSMKFTGSAAGWAPAARGDHDVVLLDLFARLGALPGPVWFTPHHEPEGDGNPADYRAMLRRVRSVLDQSGVKNVALVPTIMSWTFDARSNRTPSDWWQDDVADFAGVDHYGDTIAEGLNTVRWRDCVKFFTDKGLKIGVAEWGNRGTDAAAANEDDAFYTAAVSSGGGAGQIIALAYFDSALNSTGGSWELTGEPLKWFRQRVADQRSVLVTES